MASRTGGLVAGESCVQLGAGNVGELAPAGIAVAIENVSEATTARRAIGNRLTPMACILEHRKDPVFRLQVVDRADATPMARLKQRARELPMAAMLRDDSSRANLILELDGVMSLLAEADQERRRAYTRRQPEWLS